MILDILLWLGVAYIGLVVLFRLFMSIGMVIGSYQEEGLGGAIAAAVVSLLINIWDLAKFAFVILIIVFILRGCE